MSFNTAPIVILCLLALAFAVHAAYQVYRRKKVAEVAESLGLSFEVQAQLMDELSGFELTQKGHTKRFENCMTGEAYETTMRVFEYRFRIGYGRRQTVCSHTVAHFQSDEVDFPVFRMSPKSLFSRFCGSSLNQVEINPEFSKKYVAEGMDIGKTRRLVCQELQQLVEGKKLSIESNGKHLIIYRFNHTVNHTLLGDYLKQGLKIFLLMKESNAAPAPPIVKTADGRLALARS